MDEKWDFTIQQEVMLETRVDILVKITGADKDFDIKRQDCLWPALYAVIWNTKKTIISAKEASELDRIQGKFDLARELISKLGQTD